MKPKLSVVIPALNEEDYIARCLTALEHQKGASSFEVIVVDNGSTDRTTEIVKEFGAKLIHEKIKGVARARKVGSKAARGDILVHTDADAAPQPDWLATIEKYFEDNPDLVGVSGSFHFYDRGVLFNTLANVVGWLVILYDRIVTRGRMHLNGANLAVRRDIYEKVGGFKATLKYGEDIDLSRRMWKYGRIILTNKFKNTTSSRRHQVGTGLALYYANYFVMAVTGKPLKNAMVNVREQKSVAQRVKGKVRVPLKK